MTKAHGVVDLQINGCFGVDFNADELSEPAMVRACEQLRAAGVAGILATLITAEVGSMIHRIRQLVALRERHSLLRELIWGLHVEGPFLSDRPGFVGAHPVRWVRPADEVVMRQLLDAGGGLVRMVTLAPERDDGFRVTRMLDRLGIVVSAGHCDPSRDQLEAAADSGLSMFTHLGNGCPLELQRHDNIIQRVLSLSNRLWCSLIADGVHLPYFVIGNFLKCIGPERAIVVSDAIAATGMGSGRFSLGGAAVEVSARGESRLASGSSYLAGSTTLLPQAADNLRTYLGWSDEQVDLLTDRNPRKLLDAATRR
jgi:N-acetylglucosamine-6-phosphate deacetylase